MNAFLSYPETYSWDEKREQYFEVTENAISANANIVRKCFDPGTNIATWGQFVGQSWDSTVEFWGYCLDDLQNADVLVGIATNDEKSKQMLARDLLYFFSKRTDNKKFVLIPSHSSVRLDEFKNWYKSGAVPDTKKIFPEPDVNPETKEFVTSLALEHYTHSLSDVINRNLELGNALAAVKENSNRLGIVEISKEPNLLLEYLHSISPKTNDEFIKSTNFMARWALILWYLNNYGTTQVEEVIKLIGQFIK